MDEVFGNKKGLLDNSVEKVTGLLTGIPLLGKTFDKGVGTVAYTLGQSVDAVSGIVNTNLPKVLGKVEDGFRTNS